jgi:predicted outer membrane lipoprotein
MVGRIAACHGILPAATIEHTEGGNRKEKETTQRKAIPNTAEFCNVADSDEGGRR